MQSVNVVSVVHQYYNSINIVHIRSPFSDFLSTYVCMFVYSTYVCMFGTSVFLLGYTQCSERTSMADVGWYNV